MDQDFSDITIKDTTDRKNVFKIILNTLSCIIILFAIFSIIITIININKISNNETGYLIHHTTTTKENKYVLTTHHYLFYKIVKVNNNGSTKTYFRFWFMKDLDY